MFCVSTRNTNPNIISRIAVASSSPPTTPPPKTAAFWEIVDAGRATEEAELADLLDKFGNPPAVTLGQLRNEAEGDLADWLGERKNRRIIPHRLESCGYVPVRNPDADDSLWKIRGHRQAVYGKAAVPLRDRLAAVRREVRARNARPL